MRFDILTIFPDLLESPLNEGIIRRARAAGILEIKSHNIRDFALDKHAMTDDRPFGGGEGMVMKPEPLADALQTVSAERAGGHVVLLSPQGRPYNQALAAELAEYEHLILICGRYEGIDDRLADYIDEEVSIGDYVLTGGELPAMVLIDSISRLLPGVLGCENSASRDSFSCGLLKHPQFTRPRVFAGREVPEVLMSGDHQAIRRWRLAQSVKRTRVRRPDLLAGAQFSAEELKDLRAEGIETSGLRPETTEVRLDVALVHYPVCNKNKEIIGSAITNLDLHDIARASATYGVGTYYVVTPYEDQQRLAMEIIEHWRQGFGAVYNPDRGQALAKVAVVDSLESLFKEAGNRGSRYHVMATTAAHGAATIGYNQARQRVAAGERTLLLFGTGWGLAAEIMSQVDDVLPPLGGKGYNHLSVRSAVSIILDRLLASE